MIKTRFFELSLLSQHYLYFIKPMYFMCRNCENTPEYLYPILIDRAYFSLTFDSWDYIQGRPNTILVDDVVLVQGNYYESVFHIDKDHPLVKKIMSNCGLR